MDTDDVGERELCETLLKKFRPKGMVVDGCHLYFRGRLHRGRQHILTLAPDGGVYVMFHLVTGGETTIFGARFNSFDMILDLTNQVHTEIIEQAITNVRKVQDD